MRRVGHASARSFGNGVSWLDERRLFIAAGIPV